MKTPTQRTAAIIALLMFGLMACTFSARMYDVRTGAVTPASFKYSGSGRGAFEVSLSNGDVCKGEYSTILGGVSQWGSIYGQAQAAGGSASATVSTASTITEDAQRGTAIASCGRGGVVECEYIATGRHGQGTCRDPMKLYYRLMF